MIRERLGAMQTPDVCFSIDPVINDETVRVSVRDGRATVAAGRTRGLLLGFMKYGDAQTPWRRRIELYLLDCGITAKEIRQFCDIRTEQ